MDNKPPSPNDCHDPEIDRLIAIMEKVAAGDYAKDFDEFTRASHSETIRRIAEAFGMMVVNIQSREYNLENLNKELKDLNRALKRNILQTVITIAHSLGARDPYTEGHARRVSDYALRLSRHLGLPTEEQESIRIGGLLHDIGKIGFSDAIFNHTGSQPSPEIMAQIKTHPTIGMQILKDLELMKPILDYVLCHHEREDGSGYPQGLKGYQIPLGAKIIGIADTFDALTTDRPYQKGKPPVEAFARLRAMSGKTLDAQMVEGFIAEIKAGGMPERHA
jgi:putative nucleotidyltransferase with HDIG domain